MNQDLLSTMQQRIVASVSRMATLILSTSVSRRLGQYFSTSELLLILLTLHTLLNTTRTVPGFTASWRTLRDLMQFLAINALANYIAPGDDPQPDTTVLRLVLVLVVLECVPKVRGWVGEDMESFSTSVSVIFSDRISALLSSLGAPLFGAALGLCLRGRGLLGQTLAFVGINTLSALFFSAISGGELSLAWPVALLYFIHELSTRKLGLWVVEDLSTLFSFGLFRASDAVYASLLRGMGLQPATIFMAFLFLACLFPADPVWAGVCVLVFVQAGSEWLMAQLTLISSTDPILAGLSLVTAVHFLGIALLNTKKAG